MFWYSLLFINIVDNLKTIIPRPQEIVAVFSPRNNGIHRAKIIGQNDDGSSRCALIDIGLIDFVKAKQIFALPSYASINKVSRNVLKL